MGQALPQQVQSPIFSYYSIIISPITSDFLTNLQKDFGLFEIFPEKQRVLGIPSKKIMTEIPKFVYYFCAIFV